MTLFNLPPKEFVDNEKVFDLNNKYTSEKSQYIYGRLKQLLDEVGVGLENKFKDVADLVRLSKVVDEIKAEIDVSLSEINTEVSKLNAYIQEQKQLINQ